VAEGTDQIGGPGWKKTSRWKREEGGRFEAAVRKGSSNPKGEEALGVGVSNQRLAQQTNEAVTVAGV